MSKISVRSNLTAMGFLSCFIVPKIKQPRNTSETVCRCLFRALGCSLWFIGQQPTLCFCLHDLQDCVRCLTFAAGFVSTGEAVGLSCVLVGALRQGQI